MEETICGEGRNAKFEMHCHTDEGSACGKVPAKRMVEMYRQAGYAGLVVTDHFCAINDINFGRAGCSYAERMGRFVRGYKEITAMSNDSFRVLQGLELRFLESINDYLVYGLTGEILREIPDIDNWTLKRFSEFARKQGILVYQAHPFRNSMTIMPPELLDGIEVFNGNVRVVSRNEISKRWAEMNALKGIGGSDYHWDVDIRSGVWLPGVPKDMKELIGMLRAGVDPIIPEDDI